MIEFTGYRRENGRIGVRNRVVVIPTSVVASPIAKHVAEDFGDSVCATPHQLRPNQPTAAVEQTKRTLVGTGRNPNVGAVLVVGLGTEELSIDSLADDIATSGKPVETLSIRDVGGTRNAVDTGITLVDNLVDEIGEVRRESADVSELIFGVECGGSDATSGLAANPSVGHACDLLIENGGTACFSETPEFIGAEHILADRCVNNELKQHLLERVELREKKADLMGVDMRGAQPTPGNQAGGLTTIEEKSLGAISKGGTKPIQDMVRYAEQLPVGGGLVLMDTPGYDIESVVGKAAGGAQIVAFTTGRGSTTGNPIAPVLKIAGNPNTWSKMSNNIDINASTVLSGESITSVGKRVYEKIIEVANGTRTAAEQRGLHEYAINEIQPAERDIRG